MDDICWGEWKFGVRKFVFARSTREIVPHLKEWRHPVPQNDGLYDGQEMIYKIKIL